jgi:hypothetical protein
MLFVPATEHASHSSSDASPKNDRTQSLSGSHGRTMHALTTRAASRRATNLIECSFTSRALRTSRTVLSFRVLVVSYVVKITPNQLARC